MHLDTAETGLCGVPATLIDSTAQKRRKLETCKIAREIGKEASAAPNHSRDLPFSYLTRPTNMDAHYDSNGAGKIN